MPKRIVTIKERTYMLLRLRCILRNQPFTTEFQTYIKTLS